jgi:hypothetical protein
MDRPLMPKATAVWLVENTGLTFEQIAEFTGLHTLEIKGIADGEVNAGVRGLDPIGAGMLTRQEIDRAVKDPKAKLRLQRSIADTKLVPKKKEPRYTPLSKRQDRPDAIAWLLRNHPELAEQQICKLLGTTKNTIQQVRDRTHWKSQDIRPRDPVLLGLCSQLELDDAVARARVANPKAVRTEPLPPEEGEEYQQPPVFE